MVRKASGPPLRLDIPPLKKCDNCDGNAKFMGLYYEMPCDPCNAKGMLHRDTGEQIPEEIAVISLLQKIKEQDQLIQLLQKRLNQLEDPHAPATTRHSGKVRLD